MDLELLPLLDAQRRLLDTARGFARFREYLATMLNAEGEVALPLGAFNPLSKPHVAERLDALLAMDAEGTLRATLAEAAARLRGIPGRWRVGLVVVDDAQGGWTHRFLTDADHQFAASRSPVRRYGRGEARLHHGVLVDRRRGHPGGAAR